MLGPLGSGAAARAFQRENNLADFDFVALLDANFFDNSADRRRNFDHGFVGFQFHDWLAFGDFVAWRNHEAHKIALRDIFSEFG